MPQNVCGGTAYLQWLLAYAETRAYVAKVVTLFGSTLHPFDAGVTEPSPQISAIRAISYRR